MSLRRKTNESGVSIPSVRRRLRPRVRPFCRASRRRRPLPSVRSSVRPVVRPVVVVVTRDRKQISMCSSEKYYLIT